MDAPKERLRPHGRIRRRRVCVKQNGVRPGQLPGLGATDEPGKVRNVHTPIDSRCAVVERHMPVAQQLFNGLCKAAEISQLGRVLQAKA